MILLFSYEATIVLISPQIEPYMNHTATTFAWKLEPTLCYSHIVCVISMDPSYRQIFPKTPYVWACDRDQEIPFTKEKNRKEIPCNQRQS